MLCIGASFGGSNAFQSNQAAAQIITRYGLSGSSLGTSIGIFSAVLVGIVIIEGIMRASKVTEKIVPFMALIYVLAALFIILSNIPQVDDALFTIVLDAFSPRAGIIGGIVIALYGYGVDQYNDSNRYCHVQSRRNLCIWSSSEQ